jgi:hypothetical protein
VGKRVRRQAATKDFPAGSVSGQTPILVPGGRLRDEADPEQREEEGGEEAELVLDDPAETVDALDPAVDRDEGVTGADGLGVGVDLLWVV